MGRVSKSKPRAKAKQVGMLSHLVTSALVLMSDDCVIVSLVGV